jgi:hypothetical protein
LEKQKAAWRVSPKEMQTVWPRGEQKVHQRGDQKAVRRACPRGKPKAIGLVNWTVGMKVCLRGGLKECLRAHLRDLQTV